MKPRDKVIDLFCLYTFASVVISMLAWAAVGLGLIAVSSIYTSGVGAAAWIIGAAIYAIALYLVYQLRTTGRVGMAAFSAYAALQALALGHGFFAYGWYYAPAAGSQGTIPALVITLSMLVYLFVRRRSGARLA